MDDLDKKRGREIECLEARVEELEAFRRQVQALFQGLGGIARIITESGTPRRPE